MLRPLLVLSLLALAALLTAQTTPVAPPPPEQAAVFSVWSQRMDMSSYAGKKYRLQVAIRAEPATPESFATAFIRNEPPQGGLRRLDLHGQHDGPPRARQQLENLYPRVCG